MFLDLRYQFFDQRVVFHVNQELDVGGIGLFGSVRDQESHCPGPAQRRYVRGTIQTAEIFSDLIRRADCVVNVRTLWKPDVNHELRPRGFWEKNSYRRTENPTAIHQKWLTPRVP